MMTNHYLLIDYGNSYIKACLYEPTTSYILQTVQLPNTESPKKLLSLFRDFDLSKISKIIEASTPIEQHVQAFNTKLSKLLNLEVQTIKSKDLNNLIDLSNIDKSVNVGIDLQLSMYYLNKTIKDGAVVSFGTIYFAVIQKNRQMANCYLVPSISKALANVCAVSAIPRDLIPSVYNLQDTLDTPSSFSSGAYLTIDGFLSKVIEQNNLKLDQLIITGGDLIKFPELIKKYKFVKNLILNSIAMLVKEKGW